MTTKALTAAALVILLALSPSISECIKEHEQGGRKWLMWGWVALVVVMALVAGEELVGGAS